MYISSTVQHVGLAGPYRKIPEYVLQVPGPCTEYCFFSWRAPQNFDCLVMVEHHLCFGAREAAPTEKLYQVIINCSRREREGRVCNLGREGT